MIEVTVNHPWLIATLPQPMRCLSWAPYRGGFQVTDRVVWREVRNADLSENFDAIAWFTTEMQVRGDADSIGMLTSRNIAQNCLKTARSGLIQAACLATVGLSNAERVGQRRAAAAPVGTINCLVTTDAPLSDTALIEAVSVATQARTAAVMDHGPDLAQGRATGTGTDCIVVAAPSGDLSYAGLHTDVGETIGRAVYDSIADGTRDWMITGGGRQDA